MTNAPRPGWYPDPAGASDTFRWWDGETWSDHVSETPNAPAPRPDPDADPPRRRSPLRAVIALVVVVALFLGAGIGVGLWLWDTGSSRGNGATEAGRRTSDPRGPQSATPSEAPGQLDESTRTATIGSASMQLPDDPYELRSDPMSLPDVLDTVFLAEAEVHNRYDGEHDWSAMVALAAVSTRLTDRADLERAGELTLARLAAVMYGKNLTKVTKPEIDDRSVDGSRGLELTAEAHYAIDRLPSRYDTVRAIVVELDDGTVVTALSSVPDDADHELAELAERSLETLSIN